MSEKIEDLKIVTYPAEILRKKCNKVNIEDYATDNLKKIINKMFEIMKENNGIGLAANQAGLDCRIFVMRLPEQKEKVCINPNISYGCMPCTEEEGCLSEPGLRRRVTRNRFIIINYINEDGNLIEENMADLEARCAQHEIDHLNGIILSDNEDKPLKLSCSI